jgi:hypothetical protein
MLQCELKLQEYQPSSTKKLKIEDAQKMIEEYEQGLTPKYLDSPKAEPVGEEKTMIDETKPEVSKLPMEADAPPVEDALAAEM